MTKHPRISIPFAIITAYASSTLEQLMLRDEWLINDPKKAGQEFYRSCAPSRQLPDHKGFVLASEYVLSQTEMDTSMFLLGTSLWDWEDNDVREILKQLKRACWSEDPPPTHLVQRVELTNEDLRSWRTRVEATNAQDSLPTW